MRAPVHPAAAALALLLGAAALPGAAAAADGDEGRRLLREAFARRYGADLSARLEIVMRDAQGRERRRVLRTVTAHRDGRMRSVGRLLEPPSLRGMALLTVEAPGRADDTFVYLPALGRARRVTAGRRGDAFLGSDLTYADFERHRARDYRVEALRSLRLQGEPAVLVQARPRRPGRFDRVEFGVARSDRALLAIRYYRPGAERPARRLTAPREAIEAHGELRIPTRLEVRSPARGTETFVHVRELEVEPGIDERVFSIVTLEAERSLEAALGDGEGRPRPERPDASVRPRAPRTSQDEELR